MYRRGSRGSAVILTDNLTLWVISCGQVIEKNHFLILRIKALFTHVFCTYTFSVTGTGLYCRLDCCSNSCPTCYPGFSTDLKPAIGGIQIHTVAANLHPELHHVRVKLCHHAFIVFYQIFLRTRVLQYLALKNRAQTTCYKTEYSCVCATRSGTHQVLVFAHDT